MRIIINIDPIRRGTQRMSVRMKYQTTERDRKASLAVANAVTQLYRDLVDCMREGVDPAVTDFVDEGEMV